MPSTRAISSQLGALALLVATGCDTDATSPPPVAETGLPGDSSTDPAAAGAGIGTATPPNAAAPSCCSGRLDPGCSDVAVEACVCALDAYCCEERWDELCASEVDDFNCGACSDSVSCCTADDGPGCSVGRIEQCVCDDDPYCCNTAWDATCVGKITSLGCGTCEPLDLTIAELETPVSACLGEDIGDSLRIAVASLGPGASDQDVTVSWYLSDDDILDSSDTLLGAPDAAYGGIPPETSLDIEIGSHPIPTTATRGHSFIITVLDESNLVGESDDRNNTTATPIDISCDENGEWNVIAPLSMDPWEVEFRGTAVDPDGNSVWQLRSEPSSDSHRQLSSYDIRGSFRWSVELDWSIEDIAPDADGNFYAVGGPTYFLPAYPRVVKFSPSGEQIWELRLDAGEQYYKPRYVTTLPSGEVLVAGRATCSSAGTTQCTSDFPGGPILGPGESSSFVLAFDSSGGMRWQRFLTPKPYTETGFIGELSSNPQGDFAYLVRDERSSPWNIAVSNDSGDHSWPVDSRRISHVTLLDSGETVVSANSTGFPEFAPAHFVRFSEQGTADAPTAIEVGGLGEFTIHDVAATRTGIVASGVWLTDDWEEPTWTDGLGPTLFHSGGYAGWVAHFTSNGAPTWGYIFEKPFGQHSHVFGARVDPEGGFIVRGQADLGTKLGSEVPEPHYEEYLFLSRIRP